MLYNTTLQNEIMWLLFPPLLLVKAFVHSLSSAPFVKYHLEKLCKGAALLKKGASEMPNVFALTGLIFQVSGSLLV